MNRNEETSIPGGIRNLKHTQNICTLIWGIGFYITAGIGRLIAKIRKDKENGYI
jgi:hypothetical protein